MAFYLAGYIRKRLELDFKTFFITRVLENLLMFGTSA